MDDIDKKCEVIATKKGKATVLASHHLFKKALDLIPVEEGENEENSDSENPLSSGNYNHILFTLFSDFVYVAPPTQGTWRSNDYVSAVRLVECKMLFSFSS